jgi:hypothetical protein
MGNKAPFPVFQLAKIRPYLAFTKKCQRHFISKSFLMAALQLHFLVLGRLKKGLISWFSNSLMSVDPKGNRYRGTYGGPLMFLLRHPAKTMVPRSLVVVSVRAV